MITLTLGQFGWMMLLLGFFAGILVVLMFNWITEGHEHD